MLDGLSGDLRPANFRQLRPEVLLLKAVLVDRDVVAQGSPAHLAARSRPQAGRLAAIARAASTCGSGSRRRRTRARTLLAADIKRFSSGRC